MKIIVKTKKDHGVFYDYDQFAEYSKNCIINGIPFSVEIEEEYVKEDGHYMLWLIDQNCKEYVIAERMTRRELNEWLDTWTKRYNSPFGGHTFWVEHPDSDKIKEGIPYNSMGYIARFKKIF